MTLITLDLKFDDRKIERGTFVDYIEKKIKDYFKTEYEEAYTKGIKSISKDDLKKILLGSKTEVCYHKNNSCETLDEFLDKLKPKIGITLTNAASLIMNDIEGFNTQSDYSNKAIEWFDSVKEYINNFNTLIIPDMFIISLKVENIFDTYLQTLESKLGSTDKEIYIPSSWCVEK